jgi:Base plate wedge protein 53
MAINTATGIPGIPLNTPFFGKFPTIQYDINNTQIYVLGPHETVTDIFFRFGIIKNVLNNISSYYVYNVLDTDTPELLAENVYGDIGAGWIIIYANQIFDPQFDWPLNYDSFQKMIIDKYGSVEWAQTNTHHCEMNITRTNEFYGTTQTTNFVIDKERLTNNVPNVPYAYFTPWTTTTHRTADSNVFTADDYESPYLTSDLTYDDLETVSKSGSIPLIQGVQTYEIDGKTITETVSGQEVSYYDYELKINDDKRLIKVIQPQYYLQIMEEFKNLTKNQTNYLLGFV